MFKRNQLRQAVAAALFVASATSNLALAANEEEPNDRMFTDARLTAQRLVFTTNSMEIEGKIGVTDPAFAPVPDVDFYSFEAQEGDELDVDIDEGMKPFDLTVRSVDTVVAIFGPLPAVTIQRQRDDMSPLVPRDPGSVHIGDALIEKFRVPSTGTYVVGVTSKPRNFVDGGGTVNTTVTGASARFPNGSYKLIISGVTSAVQQINIAIKPGSGEAAPVNPQAKGVVPVALLSNKAISDGAKVVPAFDALSVDTRSLTFGSTGDEYSYLRCAKEGLDVNADGLLDLVCTFDNQLAKWQTDDLEGTLKGKTKEGKAFEGRGWLKVVPKRN